MLINRYIVKPLSSEGLALYLKYRRKEYNMKKIESKIIVINGLEYLQYRIIERTKND